MKNSCQKINKIGKGPANLPFLNNRVNNISADIFNSQKPKADIFVVFGNKISEAFIDVGWQNFNTGFLGFVNQKSDSFGIA